MLRQDLDDLFFGVVLVHTSSFSTGFELEFTFGFGLVFGAQIRDYQ